MKKNNFKIKNGKKYLFDFLSIFLAVISAFALNKWNENRNDKISEEKILKEIKNGIELDSTDFSNNIQGNKLSLLASKFYKKVITGREVNQDSAKLYYLLEFRDYAPVINRSAYESLKSSGMKTISNDSLRLQIISLYDYYYDIIDLLEYRVEEMKSYPNYFKVINKELSPFMNFDVSNNFIDYKTPVELPLNKQKELLSYLWRIEQNRKLKLNRYKMVINEMSRLKINIEKELENY